MTRLRLAMLSIALTLASVVSLNAQRDNDEQEGVEVMARGPVHEAFAVPVGEAPKPSPVINVRPPEPIEEMPPEQKPEGDNVIWVPGYWAWDAESEDFLWISGCWRDAPPDHRWVPGTWNRVEDGWQWVSGFWADDDEDDIPYLPEPPESIERGPTTPAPEADAIYAPGCWVYRETRYVWRPGFWLRPRLGWVWCPAYYIWTPGGHVFCDGYWDHPLHDCGLLFAPVRFNQRVLARGYVYRPRYAVPFDALVGALFINTKTRHYVFGDYFGDRYSRAGYVAWTDYKPQRNLSDFQYSYYKRRLDRDWEDNLRALYTARRKGEIDPPPRTLTQQKNIIHNLEVDRSRDKTVNKTLNLTRAQNVTMVAPLAQLDNAKVNALANISRGGREQRAPAEVAKVLKLEKVGKVQQEEARERAAKMREVATQRAELEKKNREAKPARTEDRPPDARLKLPKPEVKPEKREAPPKKEAPPRPQIRSEEKPKVPPPRKQEEPKPPKVEEKPKPRDVKPPSPPPQPPPRREEKPPPPPKPPEVKPPQPKPPEVKPPSPPPPPPPKPAPPPRQEKKDRDKKDRDKPGKG